jgi:tripartite-type tricarboxylate transporter receptor subunit TctC
MKQIEQQYGMPSRCALPRRAPAAADVVAGHVPMMSARCRRSASLQDGKVQALVQLGTTRHPQLPDTPTMDELGMKGFGSASWMGIFVPFGTPDAIVTRSTTI